ncbi:MAG: DUF456 domain-containing protein [Anaerolineales bacterium]|jgi:hypothetical protein
MIEIIITILTGLMILVGILGSVIPVLPDVILIWGATLGYGLIVGWGEWGPWLFGGISLMGLIGVAADVWVSSAGARMGGASLWSVIAGVVVGLIGLIFFGPLGLFGGMAVGTFIVELIQRREPAESLRAVLGVGLGYGASFFVKFGLSMGMTLLWVIWLFVD